MPTPRPPRREPRVLAFRFGCRGLLWAVADPWEIRGAGILRHPARSRNPAVLRIVRREKPTVVVAVRAGLGPIRRRLTLRHAVPVDEESLPSLPTAIARDLYPELRLVAPTRELADVAAVAISAVLHSPHLPRAYAPRRNVAAPHVA